MRIALMAVGFFAGLWLHEAGVWQSQPPLSPVHFELNHVRQTIETNNCDRVRLRMRLLSSDGRTAAALEPVLVCDRGATHDFDSPSVDIEQLSLPCGSPGTSAPGARSFEGL